MTLNTLEVENYNLDSTLTSGQSFVWRKENDLWFGSTIDGLIVLKQENPETILWQTFPAKDNLELVKRYLRTDFDYSSFLSKVQNDLIVQNAIKNYPGLRIMQQNFFETVISFIISANNNITSIRNNIRKLSILFGEKVSLEGNEYYLFPKLENIAESTIEQLRSCSLGYRSEYVKTTAITLSDAGEWFKIAKLDEDTTRNELLKLKGVGEKVADCILCYSLGFDNVTPLDVWGHRVLTNYYKVDSTKSYKQMRDWYQSNFYNLAAWVGQYLFEEIRNSSKL
jgi:N-glycosylase/DNA lyase